MTRLLRTIRFDDSDDHVFPKAARPDEWAVSGAFVFAADEPEELAGKRRQAFSNGFLAIGSFGWSTFASVAEIDDADLDGLVDRLSAHLVKHFGAPDKASAAPFALAEVEFVADLCRDAPINTLLAVRREHNEAGEVHETFRKIEAPTGPVHARIWDVAPE
ncbi:MAG TPA: DUF6505 family protein [Afifellaceae bacterium]|nr:DUF6505 family protein [Afifellaceae bacterium]